MEQNRQKQEQHNSGAIITEEPLSAMSNEEKAEMLELCRDFWKSPFGIETLKKNRERDRCQGRQDMQKE